MASRAQNPMLRRLGTGPGFASNLFTTYMHGGALADLSLVTGPAWSGSMGGSVGGRERKVHKMLADSFLQNIPSEIDYPALGCRHLMLVGWDEEWSSVGV
jgi:hypothetical protein